jgi:hypothetical protein
MYPQDGPENILITPGILTGRQTYTLTDRLIGIHIYRRRQTDI